MVKTPKLGIADFGDEPFYLELLTHIPQVKTGAG
jgi:hypothetical protein